MITLSKKQIIGMVSMKEAIHAMESAFVHLSSGNARVPTRLKLDIPDKNATSLIMPAYAVGEPHYCVKIASVNYSNPHKGLPLIHSVVKVFDASNFVINRCDVQEKIEHKVKIFVNVKIV